MPSAEHESPIALAKLDPGLLVWVLTNVFGVKVPDYHHARTQATDVQVMVPRTYRADGMLVYCDPTDQPLLAVVLEIQRGWDRTKRRTWKLYVAQLEVELDVDTALMVLCPDPKIARRYRALLEFDGLSLSLRPFIFTPNDVPLVVDADLARAKPALAAFAALCHGDRAEVDAAFPALAEALRSLGRSTAISYYDVVLTGLPVATRTRWEAFMTTTVGEFHSELLRDVAARGAKIGKAEGKAEGESRAVLTVLEARGVAVPADIRDKILASTDLAQLDTWLRRAGTATTIDDVIHG
jgi:hypothetical protein